MRSSSLQYPRMPRLRATFALIALGLVGCASHEPAKKADTRVHVRVIVARSGVVTPTELLPGIVAPYQNVALVSTLTEPADTVNVNEGDLVQRGQLLAQLNIADLKANLDADLATAASDRANTTHTVYQGSLTIAQSNDTVKSSQSAVSQAQQTLVKDMTDLQRYRQLVAQGYISEQQVAQQQFLVTNDQQAVRAAQAALASAVSSVRANGSLSGQGLQASSVEQARAQERVALAQAEQLRVQITKATITSPIDGVVVNRNLNPGEYPGTRQIFTLQQIDPLYAIVRGSGSQIAHIQTSATAEIAASDLGKTPFHGHVIGVLNQLTPGSTDFQVKILLPNPTHALRPGMAVTGTIALPRVTGIRIPTTAFTDDTRENVYSVSGDGTVKTTHVNEIASDTKQSIVRGLASGTRVIVDGQSSVSNGDKVAYQ